MQFATSNERIAFVLGFALIVLGLLTIIFGSTAIGLIAAVIGGVVLIWSIAKIQRHAPAVRDEHQQPPPR